MRLERDAPPPHTTELDMLTEQRTEIETELEMAKRHTYLAGRIPGIEKRLDVVESEINDVLLAQLESRLKRWRRMLAFLVSDNAPMADSYGPVPGVAAV